MIEIRSQSDEFYTRLSEVATVYQAAFAGPPWSENLPHTEAVRRIEEHTSHDGFGAFLAYEDENQIVGALWYEEMTIDTLRDKKGAPLANFTKELITQQGLKRVLFTMDTIVDPDFQGQGIASSLKEAYIEGITNSSPYGAVIVTRHRDDNTGIIRTSEKQGFLRTGIRIPSSQNQQTSHEFWYKIIPAQKGVIV